MKVESLYTAAVIFWWTMHGACAAASSTIRWAGSPCELSIRQVSGITAQIVLTPLDKDNDSRTVPESSAFVHLPMTERWRARELPSRREISCGNLRIKIEPNPLTLTICRTDGTPVQKLVYSDSTNGAISFLMGAPVFGLGEGERQFDRRGISYPMLNGQRASLLATYGATVPVPYLIGADGWAIFFRAPWGHFDLSGRQGLFFPEAKALGGQPLEMYVSALQEPADALSQFILLTGHPVMPPKWALGYMQSQRTLQGPDEVLQIAQTFRTEQLPIDAVIYLGTGYCPLGWNLDHGSLAFNPKSFPQPAFQIQELHDLNLKVVLHVNAVPRGLFGDSMIETSESPDHIGNYWKRHIPDMQLGVDGWWPDDGDELSIDSRLARHLCYYLGPLQTRPNVRPWSLHRNGYAGAARSGGWIWSGDTDSRWATLAAQIPVGINTGLSLTPFWGTDTGGFHPTRELTGELYTRWFEFSTFTPLFRSHGVNWHLRLPWGWNTGQPGPVESKVVPDAVELRNPQVEPICRKYLDLRYQLLSYNYSAAREAVDSGLPMMRALWLYYSNDPQAVSLGNEFLWGRDLLIAPVIGKGATNRSVYLPQGVWYDWWSGRKITGAGWIDSAVDLATTPIYVRAGAIVVLGPIRQYTAEPVKSPATVTVYPGADGSSTLYDDDGASLGYRDGSDHDLEWIRFSWDDRARKLTIEKDPRMKKWLGPARDYRVRIAGADQLSLIHFSGRRVGVDFSHLLATQLNPK